MKLGYLEFCEKLMKDYDKWYDSQQLKKDRKTTFKKSEHHYGIKKYYEKKGRKTND